MNKQKPINKKKITTKMFNMYLVLWDLKKDRMRRHYQLF